MWITIHLLTLKTCWLNMIEIHYLRNHRKGYVTANYYTEWMFAPNVGQFGSDFSNFVKIISSPALRKIVGDRLRYFKFDDPNKYRILGITHR